MPHILYDVAILLLGFGALAGGALFVRAIFGQGTETPWGVPTLWGLFILCTLAGIIILTVLYGRRLG